MPEERADKSLKKEEKRALRYVEFEVFLKTWNSYLQLQEGLERLRSLASDPEDQEALTRMSVELLELSKSIFRKVRARRRE